MKLHIRNTTSNGDSVLRLGGRIRSDDLTELEVLIAIHEGRVVLDLEEVHLVDRTGLESLGRWESGGIELRRCPPWIRERIEARA